MSDHKYKCGCLDRLNMLSLLKMHAYAYVYMYIFKSGQQNNEVSVCYCPTEHILAVFLLDCSTSLSPCFLISLQRHKALK